MRGEAPARQQIAGERSKREKEDSPLTEEEKQNTGEFHNRLLKLLESGVLFRFPEKTRFRILPRGWLVGHWPEVMSSIENAFAGYSLTAQSILFRHLRCKLSTNVDYYWLSTEYTNIMHEL